jgi:hypothetical protein
MSLIKHSRISKDNQAVHTRTGQASQTVSNRNTTIGFLGEIWLHMKEIAVRARCNENSCRKLIPPYALLI